MSKKITPSDLMEEKTAGWNEYPSAFLNYIDWEKHNENKLLHALVEMFINDVYNPLHIANPKIRETVVSFLKDCESAAYEGLKDQEKLMSGASMQNRATRRQKTTKERLKEMGLATVSPNVPNPTGKLIL